MRKDGHGFLKGVQDLEECKWKQEKLLICFTLHTSNITLLLPLHVEYDAMPSIYRQIQAKTKPVSSGKPIILGR